MSNARIEQLSMLLLMGFGAVLLHWIFKPQLTPVIMAVKKARPGIFYGPQPKYTASLRLQWTLLLMCCLSLPLRFVAMLAEGAHSAAGATAAGWCLVAFVVNLIAAIFHRPKDYRPAIGAIALGILHGMVTPGT